MLNVLEVLSKRFTRDTGIIRIFTEFLFQRMCLKLQVIEIIKECRRIPEKRHGAGL